MTFAGQFCFVCFYSQGYKEIGKNQRKDKLDNSKIMPFSVYRTDKMT